MNPPRCQLLPGSSPGSASTLLETVFGSAPSPGGLWLPLPLLSGPALERWSLDTPLQAGSRNGFQYLQAESWLAGTLDLTEPSDSSLEAVAEQVYRELQALVQALGRPHLVRVWTYLYDLLGGAGDEERYRRFCVGRARALEAPAFELRLPAATVIGTQVPGFRLAFLSSSQVPERIENPRQTPAFRYPRAYGPKSPSFSRATRLGDTLWLSGTAAVVGHETRHPSDALAQCGEMLANVDSLLEAAGPECWEAQTLKLYVADPPLAAELRERVIQHFRPATLTVLHGEVCRRELRVELEGVFRLQAPCGATAVS